MTIRPYNSQRRTQPQCIDLVRHDPIGCTGLSEASRTYLLGLAAMVLLAQLALGVGCRFRDQRVSVGNEIKAIETAPWGQPDEVLARVNGREITRGEFYVRVLRRFGTMKLLSGLIKEELFLQEAERLGLKVEPREVDAKVDEILAKMSQEMGGRDKLETQYEQEGLSLATVRRDLEREVAPQILIGKVTKARREINDEMVRAYYKKTRWYKRSITRQIAYAFADDASKLDAYNRAMRTAEKVRNGADFAEIARAESEDVVTKANGGWLGEVHKDTPMKFPEFKDVILSLKAGEVSRPVENPDGGYHVFQVVEVLESESFADCQDELEKELREMEPEVREIELMLRDLQARADVDVVRAPFVNRESPVSAGAGRSPETGVAPPEAPAGRSPPQGEGLR